MGFSVYFLTQQGKQLGREGYLLATSGFDKSAAGRAAPSAPWQEAQYCEYTPAPAGGDRAVHQPCIAYRLRGAQGCD